MKNAAKRAVLDEIFPIDGIENDVLISKDLDLTVGFKVKLPDVFSLTTSDYDCMHSAWCKAIKNLPNYTVFHKQDWFFHDKVKGVVGDVQDMTFMQVSSSKHFEGRNFLNHECYVFLTKTKEQKLKLKSNFSTLCSGRLIPREIVSPDKVNAFLDSCAQFARIVNDCGLIEMERLKGEDYVGKDDDRLSFGLLDRYFSLKQDSPNVIEDIYFKENEVRVGNKHLMVYSLSNTESLPLNLSADVRCENYSTDLSEVSISYAGPLGLTLDCDHIYNQYIIVEDSDKILSELEKKSKNMISLSKLSRSNAINAQYIEEYLSVAHSMGVPAVKAHFNVMLWDENLEQLKEHGNDVLAAMKKMGCSPKNESIDCPSYYWAGIPGNESDFPYEECFLTFPEIATCFLNGESNYGNSKSSFGIKMADRYGCPIHLDISDEPMEKGWISNRNKFILGPSGSGKSFFTNHMVRQYYEQGTHVLIVDTGHSYKGLCSYINRKTNGEDGIYFTYTNEKPITFNPFYTEDYVFEIEKVESLVNLLLILWKSDGQEVTKTEENLLTSAINMYIDKITADRSIRPCFDSFYEFMLNDYQGIINKSKDDGLEVKESDFNLRNFLITLQAFYKGGTYDFLLNSKENIDLLSKRFVVFEIDSIQDHKTLFPIVTIIIMEAFINKMRRLNGIRKMILIEEAWRAIAKANMAGFIKYLYKTVRKFFGEAVVVTQEVEDIISSPIVKESIVDNSHCKILLDMKQYMTKFDKIQENLGLSEKQKAQILSVNINNDYKRKYKEVWIGLGTQKSAVYATETSFEEYLIYTTEQREKVMVENLTEEMGGDIEKAVAVLAEEERKKWNDKINGNY